MTERVKTTEAEPVAKTTEVEPEVKIEPAPEPAFRGPYDHDWRGPYEEMATAPAPPDPGPGASLVIDTPIEGATVPPVHDVTGTGARPGTDVTLAYGEDQTAVATVAAGGDGTWGFTGDTPAALGPQTWTVSNEGRTTSVSVIVEEPVVEGTNRVAEGSSKKAK